MTWHRPSWLLLLILSAACAGPVQRPDAPAWRIDPRPDLTVGGGEADGQDLFQVRGAALTPEGGVAVLNGGSSEVRLFDRAGALVRVIGHPGEGPGEFRAPIALGLGGDTLLVYDVVLRRLSRFTLAGALMDEAALDGGWASPALAMLVAPDGDLVAVDIGLDAHADPKQGTRRPDHVVWRRHRDGAVDSIGAWPGTTYLVRRTDSGEGLWQLPFGSRAEVAIGPGLLVVGNSGTGQIEVFGRDGERRGTFTGAHPEREVTEADRTGMIEWLVGQAPATGAATTRSVMETAVFPDRMPRFGAILVDDAGLVWVAPYWTPNATTLEWLVHDLDGTVRARVAIPAALRVLHVGVDHLLALGYDADGVERVQRYPLVREAS